MASKTILLLLIGTTACAMGFSVHSLSKRQTVEANAAGSVGTDGANGEAGLSGSNRSGFGIISDIINEIRNRRTTTQRPTASTGTTAGITQSPLTTVTESRIPTGTTENTNLPIITSRPNDDNESPDNCINDRGQKIKNAIGKGIEKAVNRIGNAAVKTYEEERDSINQSLNSIRDAEKKIVDAQIDILQTKINLAAAGPKFGYNLLTNN